MQRPGLVRRHAVARRIVRRYRELASETADESSASRSVVVACSGGADSGALALALGTAKAIGLVTLAHVRHDMRSADEADADAETVRGLAEWLGAGFASTEAIAGRRSSEATYRRLRYASLAAVATDSDAGFVATGHHANDQLETLVMALARGAGPHGMRGIASRRRLVTGVELVRPMLRIGREDCEELCRVAGFAWREDTTNSDASSNLRAALRAKVSGPLLELKPHAALRAARHAELMRDAAGLVREAAMRLEARATTAGGGELLRDALRHERAVVVAAVIRRACTAAGMRPDALTGAKTDAIVRAIHDHGTEPRRFEITNGGAVAVSARLVLIEPADDNRA